MSASSQPTPTQILAGKTLAEMRNVYRTDSPSYVRFLEFKTQMDALQDNPVAFYSAFLEKYEHLYYSPETADIKISRQLFSAWRMTNGLELPYLKKK